MKIVAKTKGPTLVCSSGDFLDSYKYRVVNYDPQVRGWNNRDLLEVKGFVQEFAEAKDLDELGVDAFLKKWADKPEVEFKEEVKPEVEPEVEEEPKFEVKKNRKNKK